MGWPKGVTRKAMAKKNGRKYKKTGRKKATVEKKLGPKRAKPSMERLLGEARRKRDRKVTSSIAEKARASESPTHTRIANDAKVDPAHYAAASKSGQQVIDVLEDFGVVDNAYRFVALQYMFRAGRKDTENTVTDLLKAIWFINREIAHLARLAEDAAHGRDRSHDVRMAS